MAPRSTCWLIAAACHHAVLQRHAAEGQHDLGVLGHLVPGDVALGEVLVIAEDVRQEHRGGAGAVAVDRAHIAAERDVQEAVDLALGVVEAAGARPAIGAAEDRAGTVRVAHAAQLGAEQIERLVPRIGDEFVAAAASSGPGPRSSQPRRTIGCAMRARWRSAPGKLPMMRFGSGSPGCGRTSSRPRHRAENTPQCEVCGRNGDLDSAPEFEEGLSITSLMHISPGARTSPVHPRSFGEARMAKKKS